MKSVLPDATETSSFCARLARSTAATYGLRPGGEMSPQGQLSSDRTQRIRSAAASRFPPGSCAIRALQPSVPNCRMVTLTASATTPAPSTSDRCRLRRAAPALGVVHVQAGSHTAGSTCRAGTRITLGLVAQVSGPGLVQFVADGGLVLGWAAARVEDEPAVSHLQDDRVWFGGNVRAERCPVELAGPVLVRYHHEVHADEPLRRGKRGVSGGSDLRGCHDVLRSPNRARRHILSMAYDI